MLRRAKYGDPKNCDGLITIGETANAVGRVRIRMNSVNSQKEVTLGPTKLMVGTHHERSIPMIEHRYRLPVQLNDPR